MNIPKAVRINLSISVVIITVLFFALKPYKVNTVPPPVQVIKIAEPDKREQRVQVGLWEVAKVFGRTTGCKDADPELGRLVAEAAIDENVDPKLIAAVIGVESRCSPFATSSRGAVGLMQVRAETWKGVFDFKGRVNLLNERDNIRTGSHILAGYIKTYGTEDGVLHYQGTGTGTGCPTCDPTYVDKVLALAGK